jgi:hypothetical protein
VFENIHKNEKMHIHVQIHFEDKKYPQNLMPISVSHSKSAQRHGCMYSLIYVFAVSISYVKYAEILLVLLVLLIVRIIWANT